MNRDENAAPDGASSEPTLSTRQIADFHAGALDAAAADQIRSRIAADPRAARFLAELDSTTTSLAALGDEEIALPADVEARLAATLDDLNGR